MLIERILKTVDKPLRAALLASFISAGGGIPAASASGAVNSGKKIEFVGREELISAQENPGMETNRQVIEAILKKDLAKLKQLLHPLYHDWNIYGRRSDFGTLPEQEILALFNKAFTKGQPSCLGFMLRPGWNTEEASIVFENLSALEGQNLSRASMVTVGFRRGGALKWGISEVEELTQTQLSEIRKNLQACSAILQKPEAKPAPQKAQPQKDLPKGRIVYAAKEKDGPDATYTSNADGSDKKVLINNSGHDRRYMTLLPNGRVAYSEWKDGKANIVVLDPGTGQKQELTTSEGKPANTIDICPSPDGTNSVVFTRSGFGQRGIVNEILRAFLDGKKPETLKPGSKEDFCPTVSPNRKYVAATLVDPAAGFSEPQGVAVYEYEGYGKDQAKLIARLAGIRLLGWMPGSQEVLLTKKGSNGESLYIVSIDGKQSRLITDMDVVEASASADGKWILVAASGEGRGPADLWLFSAAGGSGIRITNTPYNENSPQWLTEGKPEPKPEVPPKPEPVVTTVPEPEPEVEPLPQTFIAVVPGMLDPVQQGIEVSGRFVPLRERVVLEADLEITESQIFVAGLWGGYFEHGRYTSYDYTCENTLQTIERFAENQASMILKWDKIHPKDKLIIVAHSLGGPVMLRGLEMVRDIDPDIDLSRVVLFTLDSPNQGIGKPIISQLGQILPKDLPDDCYLDFGDFRSPPPQVLDYPVTRELRAMWSRHDERREELADLMTWFRVQGGRAGAAGNYQDCIIAWEPCGDTFPGNWVWDLILPPILRFIVKDPYSWLLPEVLYTQQIPGANKNIMQFLGKTPNWGHTPYLIPGQGMDMLIGWIREEVRRKRRLLKAA